MTANTWVSKLEKIAKQEEPVENDIFARFRELRANINVKNLEAQNSIVNSINSSGIGGSINSGWSGTTYPYVGDPPSQNQDVTITTTGTGYPTVWPNTFPIQNPVSASTNWPINTRTALDDFFNITYLDAEATCAVTRRKIQKGEPVLILFEHVICKEAFQKMLTRQFESMMFRMEEMSEVDGYDS